MLVPEPPDPGEGQPGARRQERADFVEALTRKRTKPGVLAYDGDEVVGWAAVAPRADLPFARSTKIPHVDDQPAWSVWCIRVRPGHRGRGISHVLLEGAVTYAVQRGAPVIEGYPVDNKGEKVDLTMAYVGTRAVFEAAGFALASSTDATSRGVPAGDHAPRRLTPHPADPPRHAVRRLARDRAPALLPLVQ